MSDRGRFVLSATIVGGALGILCCATPFLVAAVLGVGGLAAWFGSGARVLALACLATIAVVGFLLYRDRYRHRAESPSGSSAVGGEPKTMNDCCAPTGNKTEEPSR